MRMQRPAELPVAKILVTGDGGVGKEALVIRLCEDRFKEDRFKEEYDPSIESSYAKMVEIDGVSCRLDMTVVAGQEEYAVLRPVAIR